MGGGAHGLEGWGRVGYGFKGLEREGKRKNGRVEELWVGGFGGGGKLTVVEI
ncbi:uncharacterized protein G2W53_004017 [Senna tora]|uniref:Uncharacterized protein n=1 Tax=Senna tora TaxID=362788 RepID=A0A834XB54_9FABA|nr:uncharacterized protein G2W53_004017 [Senna tora]